MKTVVRDEIEIPKELKRQGEALTLCIDTMFVNGQGFLTSIDKTIKYRAAIPIDSRRVQEYFRALDAILRHYNKAGYIIKRIECDGEYKSMMEEIKDELDIDMNFTNVQDHVPEAERNNRTIKE